ncbi:MAG TPA: glycoside hydrolase family 16 protein [Stellaceae bacterium]|nr:glycoside hydrolase family 16 protein [Stellaceae bacterium]
MLKLPAALIVFAAFWLCLAGLGEAGRQTAAADVAATGDGAPAGYRKVFGDEFDASRLDTGKWWTRYINDGGQLDFLNDEQERYRESGNHVMTGHSLVLTARKTADGPAGYTSGMIRSKATFKYGYFVARMKIPGAVGVWPAFWLNSATRASDGKIAWPPEIDIAEIANNGVEDTTKMLHVGLVSHGAQAGAISYVDRDFHGDWSYWQAPASLADDFHRFAALWAPDDTVSFFIDGRLIEKAGYKWVYDDGTPAGLAHVILNLAIGGPNWAGRHGIDGKAFPQGVEVDFVRVYQKPGSGQLGTDAVGKDLCRPQGDC